MKSFPLKDSLLVSVRLYRALLVAYPKKFREHYETQMVQVFRDSFRDAYHYNGMSGVIDLWLHTFADLFVTALIERLMERSQYMFSPKLISWCGGMASLFGGLFWMISVGGGLPLKLALILELCGVVGLRMRQAGQGSKVGVAGFAFGIIGTVLAIAYLSQDPVSGSFPYMEDPALAPGVLVLSLALFIQSIGLALLGDVSLRAKNPHRWRGLPVGLSALSAISGVMFWLVVSVPLSQAQFPWESRTFLLYPAVLWLLGLSWIGLGIMLMAEANTPVAQHPPASA